MNQSINFYNVKVLATICSMLSASAVALPSYFSYGYRYHGYRSYQSVPYSGRNGGNGYSYGLPGGDRVSYNLGGYQYSRPGHGQTKYGQGGAYGPQQPQEMAPVAENPAYTGGAQGSPQQEQKQKTTEQDSDNEADSPAAQDGEYGQRYPQQQGSGQGYPQQQGGGQGYPQQQGSGQGNPQQQGGGQGYPQQQKPQYETEDNKGSTNTTSGSGATGSFNIDAMLKLVNKERENAPTKAPALTLNDKLTQAAQLQSDHQKSTGKMSHNGPQGLETLSLRVKKFQYTFGAIAENVADGEMTVEDVMYCWMQSPCHRANLLNPAYSEFGSALSGKFWTQVFGTSGYLTKEQQTNPNQGSCDPNNHTPYQCNPKSRGNTKYYY